jgi:uncharacterized protein (TIGR03437 family)
VSALSSGGIGTVIGTNFGGGAMFQKPGSGDLVNGNVPTNFQSVCLEAGGVRAPILGVSNTQVNFQTPNVTSSGTVTVRVIAGCGTANETPSNSVSVPAQAATPEFFYFVTNADGHNPVAAADSVTGAYLVAANQFPGAGFGPAHPNEYVTVYATGFGATVPPVAPGVFAPQLAQVLETVQVTLGGRQLPDANVLYAGITPDSPGLYQLNLLLPADTPDGDLALVITIGGVPSPAGAYLTVSSMPAQ